MRVCFAPALADVFDNEVPEAWRARLWELIEETPYLDWLLLTKRVGNIQKMLPDGWNGGWQNVSLGISVVNQEEANRDIPKLLRIPACARFLSMEPLLGPVNLFLPLGAHNFAGFPEDFAEWTEQRRQAWFSEQARATYITQCECIDWVIVGGESGPNARPMHPHWARDLRDQCVAARVPFFFKQWGEYVSVSEVAGEGPHFVFPDHSTVRRVGKKNAGRALDGRTWDEIPKSA